MSDKELKAIVALLDLESCRSIIEIFVGITPGMKVRVIEALADQER